MSTKTHSLHSARLHNNCPTCFGTDGLEFTFHQEEKESLFFHRPHLQVDEKLFCHKCNNQIYPVNWTEDIERVYDYNRKIAETNKQYLQVKPLFYILIISATILVAVGIYFLIALI